MNDTLPVVTDILKKAFALLVLALMASCGLSVWLGSMLMGGG